MSRSPKANRNRFAFFSLVAVVILSGWLLWSQGDLTSPLQSTAMLIGLSSGEAGFAMVGDRAAPEMPADNTAAEDTAAAEPISVAASSTGDTAAPGSMTLAVLTTELAAAGVDVDAVTAKMAAEGRSLDNLLSVVNSGRVTVAELAARLNGESVSDSAASSAPPPEASTSLLDIRWDELGSVAYNLWLMLITTVVIIVIARPVGWLVKRLKRAPAAPVG